MSTRLIQLANGNARRVALVEEPRLRLLAEVASIYALANRAVVAGIKLSDAARKMVSPEHLDYDPIYDGRSDWRILPAIDHPEEPARCLVSGTGLTHLGSARDRQAMHMRATQEFEELTDSMKMFRWGIDGGRPASACIGVSPEWFYKGTCAILQANGEPLDVPPYSEDGGEEAVITVIYLIGQGGQTLRIGMTYGYHIS